MKDLLLNYATLTPTRQKVLKAIINLGYQQKDTEKLIETLNAKTTGRKAFAIDSIIETMSRH